MPVTSARRGGPSWHARQSTKGVDADLLDCLHRGSARDGCRLASHNPRMNPRDFGGVLAVSTLRSTIPIDTTSLSFQRAAAGASCRAPAPPEAIDVLGVPSRAVDYDGTMDWMDATVAARGSGYVCVAATHTVMVAQEDPELREAVLGASARRPRRPAARLGAERARPPRCPTASTAPTSWPRYCERAAEQGTRMYLYGGRNQGALVQLALNLRRRFPGLQIVGGYSPPFRDLDRRRGGRDRRRDQPLGRGRRLGRRSACPSRRSGWPRCATASTRRSSSASAPRSTSTPGSCPRPRRWMQSSGLEWAFRLAQEPRRLWRRYAALQPALRRGLRSAVRAQPLRARPHDG